MVRAYMKPGNDLRSCCVNVHIMGSLIGFKWRLFYNGLNGQTWTIVDASANEAILSKSYNEAYEILERMANSNYQWPTERANTARRVA